MGPFLPSDRSTIEPVTATHPLAYPIQLRLNEIDQGNLNDGERELAGRVRAAYVESGYQPLWVSQAGVLPHAAAVMSEIAKAKDWGLDPAAFYLPPLPAPGADAHALANFEARLSFAAAKYAFHAKGGRVDPSQLSKWLDQKPRRLDPKTFLKELTGAEDPAAVLRAQHPKHAGFKNLLKAYTRLMNPAGAKPVDYGIVMLPPGPRIEPGSRHADVALLRQRLGILGTADEETLYDDRLVAAVRNALKIRQRTARPTLDDKVREVLNNPPEVVALKKKLAEGADARKILVNLERWRWLPEDFGDTYIWNSLTEFETRVIKGQKEVHRERIIIGKPDTQTPVFSDRMEYVVFQPEWGVPNSIKVKQLLPALQDGNDHILEERNMKIMLNGKEKDPGDYDWEKTDIRYVPVYQQPGPQNPLGQVKFMFPNKHAVYMHDTPQKSLFNDRTRTHSHGCIRVRNPRRLAEIIMGLDQGWGASEVSSVLQATATPSNRVDLKQPIPVHNTYFTAFADDNGQVTTAADVYSHDKRISDALDGVPIAQIAQRDPALILERELEEISPSSNPSIEANGASALVKRPGARPSQAVKPVQVARKYRNDDEVSYYAPAKPKFSGYTGLTFANPQPAYKPAKKPTSGWRSPPTITDMIMIYGRN